MSQTKTRSAKVGQSDRKMGLCGTVWALQGRLEEAAMDQRREGTENQRPGRPSALSPRLAQDPRVPLLLQTQVEGVMEELWMVS